MPDRREARALEGVLVVALEQAVAAPFCTSRLADAGARVIKIERPEGDFARGYDGFAKGDSAYFVWLNRGKESVVLDLKQPGDAAIFKAMLRRADVFVQNLAPGAVERLGFGPTALQALNPRLIVCNISGYGESGPFRDMKAYDLLIQCEAGLASVTGTPDGPGRAGVSVADIGCGMYAHAAILEALFERARTGVGRSFAVSLFDSLADWMTVPLLQLEHTGRPPPRVGLNHPTIAPYGAYRAKDGQLVVISIQNEREWATLCTEVLARPDLAGDSRFASNTARCQNRAALDAEIETVFSALPCEALVQRLRAAKIAHGRVNSVADLAHHPQLRRVTVPTPRGDVSLPAPPAQWKEATFTAGAVPRLDEHGDKIRREFGGG